MNNYVNRWINQSDERNLNRMITFIPFKSYWKKNYEIQFDVYFAIYVCALVLSNWFKAVHQTWIGPNFDPSRYMIIIIIIIMLKLLELFKHIHKYSKFS